MIKNYSVPNGKRVEISIRRDGLKIGSIESSEIYLDTDKFKCIRTTESTALSKIIIEVEV